MGAKHHLSLEIPETANTKLFRVSDTSFYANDLAVECPTLQILSPGFNVPKDVEAIPGFNYVLNACTLGTQVSGCGDVNADLAEMRLIKSMIDAAKAKVEYCHNPREGYELFVYALRRLEKVCV